MNKENAHQFLPLVQALAEGKTIQLKCGTDQDWTDWPNPKFDREISAYRIKPESREWDMWVTPKGELTSNSDMMMRESVRVREILD